MTGEGGCGQAVMRPYRTRAQARQPNAAVEAPARTMFHWIHRASLKRSRTAARLVMLSGFPAAFIASLSGTLIANVMIRTARYRTSAVTSQGSIDREPAPKLSATAKPV